ncbi:MAG: hypothetical protein AABY42_01095 [Nitrospirota bacterium]
MIEDELHLNVLTRVLNSFQQKYTINRIFGKKGKNFIKDNLRAYNQAASISPYLVLVDLDRGECPLIIIKNWFTFTKSDNLLFRIAVREAEAWLLSDRDNFASFMGVSRDKIDLNPENIPDPKEYIINLARKSRKRKIKEDLVPEGKASVGRNFNTCLSDFVLNHWDIKNAKMASKSLERLVIALNNFDYRRN